MNVSRQTCGFRNRRGSGGAEELEQEFDARASEPVNDVAQPLSHDANLPQSFSV
jgi:hypothetical protein